VPAKDPPDAHPPRPPRARRRAGAAVAGHRGVGATSAGRAHARPVAPDVLRRADLRRRHGAPVGRHAARPRGPSAGALRAARDRPVARGSTHRATPRTTCPTCHEPTGTALVGDVAGCRIADGPILPPTPPPDVDLEAWHASLRTVAEWSPERLAITHFGTWDDVARTSRRCTRRSTAGPRSAKRLDDEPATPPRIEEEMRTKTSDPAVAGVVPARDAAEDAVGGCGRGTGRRRRRRRTDRRASARLVHRTLR
jgi:hypothetical protein